MKSDEYQSVYYQNKFETTLRLQQAFRNLDKTILKGILNKIKAVGIAALALLVVIVVLQNTQLIETKLLFMTVPIPNAALLFGTLVIGYAFGVLTAGRVVSAAKRPLPDAEPVGKVREL